MRQTKLQRGPKGFTRSIGKRPDGTQPKFLLGYGKAEAEKKLAALTILWKSIEGRGGCTKASNAPWEAVRQAQVSLSKGDPLGAWVDCDDLNNKERNGVAFDDLHYTKEGYELLGRRYARQAKALIEGRKPAEDGRP